MPKLQPSNTVEMNQPLNEVSKFRKAFMDACVEYRDKRRYYIGKMTNYNLAVSLIREIDVLEQYDLKFQDEALRVLVFALCNVLSQKGSVAFFDLLKDLKEQYGDYFEEENINKIKSNVTVTNLMEYLDLNCPENHSCHKGWVENFFATEMNRKEKYLKVETRQKLNQEKQSTAIMIQAASATKPFAKKLATLAKQTPQTLTTQDTPLTYSALNARHADLFPTDLQSHLIKDSIIDKTKGVAVFGSIGKAHYLYLEKMNLDSELMVTKYIFSKNESGYTVSYSVLMSAAEIEKEKINAQKMELSATLEIAQDLVFVNKVEEQLNKFDNRIFPQIIIDSYKEIYDSVLEPQPVIIEGPKLDEALSGLRM